MITAAIGMSASMAILAGAVSVVDRRPAQIAGVVFTFIFNIWFPIGLFSIGYVYAAEILPLEVRAQGMGIAVSANWLMNFLVAEVTPIG